MVYVFSREAIRELISLYEQNPELYNSSLPDYKKKVIRQKVWDKIVLQFRALFPEATKEDIQKKMTNLRTQFFTEFNKYKKSLLSGSGVSDIYKPSWWCYDLLMFFNVNNPVEEGESNLELPGQTLKQSMNDESETIFEGTVEELKLSNVIATTPKSLAGQSRAGSPISSTSSMEASKSSRKNKESAKRKRQATSNSVTDDLIQQATEALRSGPQEADHFEAFALNLASEMRQIKNAAVVIRLKRKFLNEVYDILDEQNS